ncbi:MAG: glycoside hydrolase family 105 protein [Flavisolibacter sp.]
MKKLFTLLVYSTFSFISFSQTAASTWSVKFANAMISRYQPTINAMTSKGWEYSNSIILHGMQKVYEQNPDVNYLNYIQAYIDTYVNGSGTVTGLSQSLDRIHPGILCLFLYEKTGLLKYKTAATNIRNYLITGAPAYPKTPNGGYWHKNTTGATGYDNVMMLDGIYMAHPFLVKYGQLFSDNIAIDTAVNQTLMLDSYLHSYTTHLIKHAWDYAKVKSWASPTTGISSEVWSRAMGWYVMAVVDMLKYLPNTHPKYNQIKNILTDLAIGIQNTQDPTTGLWYQVVDKGGSAGNYLETSGSAMFVYALKTAVDKGWINSSYLAVAQKGWTGLKTKISIYTDGMPAINDFAPAMSVQNNYAAYVGIVSVDAPTASGTQHPHGFAAIMMAASVMEFPLGTLPIKFINFTGSREGSNVSLKWQVGDYTEASSFIVERSQNGIDFTAVDQIKPQSNSSQFSDIVPENSTIYYRIKAVLLSNEIDYSKTIRIDKESISQRLIVSSNNGELNIIARGIKAGSYWLTVSNSAGQTLLTKSFYTNSERLEETVALPASAKGIFYIQLKGTETLFNRPIIIR